MKTIRIKLVLLSLTLVLLTLAGCKSVNQYMVKDSNEYKKTTQNFVGDWAVTDYSIKSSNLLDSTYEKITVNFDFDSSVAKLTYYISEGKLSEKMLDWKTKYPDLKVDEYKVVITTPWKVSSKGTILYFNDQKQNLVINGSGKNFQGFYEWEKAKFEASKNVGKDSGLGGFLMNKAIKSATGSKDLFPKLNDQFNFNFQEKNRYLTIFSMKKTKITLKKIN